MRFRLTTSALLPAILLALLVTLAAGCKKHVDPMPASGAVDGWQKTGDTQTYAAKDLWQYMDGGADQYVSAGVVSTATSDYQYQSGLESKVDVHTMKDAAGAKKIFDAAFASGGSPVSIGDAGVASPQSVAFRKGEHVVNLVAYQAKPDAQQALTKLAQAIADKL